jgi:hypothetical protein
VPVDYSSLRSSLPVALVGRVEGNYPIVASPGNVFSNQYATGDHDDTHDGQNHSGVDLEPAAAGRRLVFPARYRGWRGAKMPGPEGAMYSRHPGLFRHEKGGIEIWSSGVHC